MVYINLTKTIKYANPDRKYLSAAANSSEGEDGKWYQ